MATVTLYTAQSNVTLKRAPEFVAVDDRSAEHIAMKLLDCRPDDIVLLHLEIDYWDDPGRVWRAIKTAKKTVTD